MANGRSPSPWKPRPSHLHKGTRVLRYGRGFTRHISVFLRVLAHTHPLGLLAHRKRLNSWPLIEECGEDMIGVGYAARSLHNRSYLTFRLVLYAPGIPRTASKRTLHYGTGHLRNYYCDCRTSKPKGRAAPAP